MRTRLYLVLVIVIAAGCTPSAPTPQTTTGPSSTPVVSSPSPETPSASPGSEARELTAGKLQPGTYTRTGFEPEVTFAVNEGWAVGSLANGFFDIQQQQGTPDVIAVQFGQVEGVIAADGALARPADVEGAVASIKANRGLEVVGESPSSLGGLTGRVIEVRNTTETHTPILDVAPGRLGIDSGRQLWVGLFETSAGLLAVMVGGSIDDWEHALAVAEPVLETVVID